MMEVMEEEELANMRAHQEHFEQIRNSELAETQRLEEAEKRRFEEKERRVGQEQERVEREQQVTEQEVTSNFLPGLMQQVDVQLESMRTSRQLAGELIEAAAVRSQAMLAEAAKLRTEVEAAKAKLAAEKAEAAAAAAAAEAAEAAGEEGG